MAFFAALLLACSPADPAAGDLDQAEAAAGLGPARAPRPILLLHGMAGFDRIGPLEYYFRVADDLEAAGHQVYTTEVDPLQRIEVRAGELAEQIDAILAASGADRVHLIAHSQGGLDARYLISSLGYGDRVATLTTIATPHRGSRVADIALGLVPGPAEEAIGFLADLLVGGVVGSEQDLVGQIHQLTEEYAVGTFDPANPDDPRVEYYAVAGETHLAPWLNPLRDDACDPLLLAGYALLAPDGANDGLVSVESARHGTLLATIPADHFDEVGQILGSTALAFDHLAFYRRLAAFLTDPARPF